MIAEYFSNKKQLQTIKEESHEEIIRRHEDSNRKFIKIIAYCKMRTNLPSNALNIKNIKVVKETRKAEKESCEYLKIRFRNKINFKNTKTS